MILNKFGSFVVGRNNTRIIPYKHHLDDRAWMVTIISGQVDPCWSYYAVWGGDNEAAAEEAYCCYLRDKEEKKRLKNESMLDLDATKMTQPRRLKKYINVKEA